MLLRKLTSFNLQRVFGKIEAFVEASITGDTVHSSDGTAKLGINRCQACTKSLVASHGEPVIHNIF